MMLKRILLDLVAGLTGIRVMRVGYAIVLARRKQQIVAVGDGAYLPDQEHPIRDVGGGYKVIEPLADRPDIESCWYSGLIRYGWNRHLQDVVSRYGIDLVIDVGANKGQFGRYLREELGYRGAIVSFEPLPSAFQDLAREASFDSGWRAVNCALGSVTGEQILNEADTSEFSSFLDPTLECAAMFSESAAKTQGVKVVVKRLDEIWPEVAGGGEKRIFLKMDTQGYDLEVFRGLGEQRSNVTLLQSELSVIPMYSGMPHITESISVFEDQGFQLVGLSPVTFDPCSSRAIEFDCLFLNAAIERTYS